MKILHVPFCYYPDPVGGTEVYVASLAGHLVEEGAQVAVAAPGTKDTEYEHEGVRVWRFAVSELRDLAELYGEGDARAAQQFSYILDEEGPDLVHFHAFTRGVSLRLLREATGRQLPTVFTYHTPTASCLRGTLMRWGTEPCDGMLRRDACCRCTLNARGLHRAASVLVGSLPSSLGRRLGAMGLSGGIWTALRMSELVELRHRAFRALMREVDRVVALSAWTRELLLRNGVPTEKILVLSQGLPVRRSEQRPRGEAPKEPPLRIAFLGRLDPTKGAEVLIRALRGLPSAAMELHVYGIVQGDSDRGYERHLRDLAARDARISFHVPVPAEQVVSLLRSYHAVAVPSKVMETGPLVVLQAFAAGAPVVGSNLGGIAERVSHDVNGILVEPASIAAWRQALGKLAADPAELSRLRAGIRPPQVMAATAREMLGLYRGLLKFESCASEARLRRVD
jgi:glycosyltransferase involved in cell wall biosynthesis